MNKKENNTVKQHIKELVTPIFNKVPHEPSSNHRMVGKTPKNTPITFLWQPHNYRLYFQFSKVSAKPFNPKKPLNHTLKKYKSMVATFNTAYTYTALNYDSEHKYDNFMFCQIRVKKNQVEVINKSHDKQWRKITAASIEEIDERIDQVMNNLRDQAIEALKSFLELHGGSSNLKVLNERSEHGIHGEEYLDKLPKELVIHDTYFKKLYKEKAELLSTAAVKNYISNRSMEKIAPEIALSINELNTKLDSFTDKALPPIEQLALNMETHIAVMKNIETGIVNFNETVKKLEAFLTKKTIWQRIRGRF